MTDRIINFPKNPSLSQEPQKPIDIKSSGNFPPGNLTDIALFKTRFTEQAKLEIINILNGLIASIKEWQAIAAEFLAQKDTVKNQGKLLNYGHFKRGLGQYYTLSGLPSADAQLFQQILEKRKIMELGFESLVSKFNQALLQLNSNTAKYRALYLKHKAHEGQNLDAYSAQLQSNSCGDSLQRCHKILEISNPDMFNSQAEKFLEKLEDLLKKLDNLKDSYQ